MEDVGSGKKTCKRLVLFKNVFLFLFFFSCCCLRTTKEVPPSRLIFKTLQARGEECGQGGVGSLPQDAQICLVGSDQKGHD